MNISVQTFVRYPLSLTVLIDGDEVALQREHGDLRIIASWFGTLVSKTSFR